MNAIEKSINSTKRKTTVHDILSCRRVLNIMVFLGFMVNYMLRVNLTFAIVDMVMKPPNDTNHVITYPVLPKRPIRSIPNEMFFEENAKDGVGDVDESKEEVMNRQFRKQNFLGDNFSADKKSVKDATNVKLLNTLNTMNGNMGGIQLSNGDVGGIGMNEMSRTMQQNAENKNGFSSYSSSGGSRMNKINQAMQQSGSKFSGNAGNMNGFFSYSSSGGSGMNRLNQTMQQPGSTFSGNMNGFSSYSSSGGSGMNKMNQTMQQSGSEFSRNAGNMNGFSSFSNGGGNEMSMQQSGSMYSGNSFSSDAVNLNGFSDASNSSGAGTNKMNGFSNSNKVEASMNENELINPDLNEKQGEDLNKAQKKEGDRDPSNLILDEEKVGNIRTIFLKDENDAKLSVGNSELENKAEINKTTILNGGIQPVPDRVKRFSWSEAQQGILIGSFFWGYICTELPGGRLAELIGARKVFGYATLLASVVTLLTPLSAKINFIFVVIIRVLLGLFLGPTWPSMLPLAAKWIPPDERGKFLSNMMGSTLGAGFTLPICGFIISVLSWEYVFYITGLLGFIWSIIWFLIVFDSPSTHPRISAEERAYIETKLGLIPGKDNEVGNDEKLATHRLMQGQTKDDIGPSDSEQSYRTADDSNRNYSTFSNGNAVSNTDQRNDNRNNSPDSVKPELIRKQESSTPTSYKNGTAKATAASSNQSNHANAPWFHILTSVPVWAFVLTHGASVFGYNTITNQLPTYMKYILHYNIKENGLLSSLPYIGKYFAALVGGSIADRLLRSSKYTKGFVRKLFTGIGVLTPGLMMILQIFLGNDKFLSIFIFTTALIFNGCVTGGYLGNSLDIAPNYSGTVFGLGNMLSGFSGAISAILVGYLTDHNQVYGQWQIVFLIVAVVYITGALIFLVFGATEPQHWNYSSELHKKEIEDDSDNEETIILHSARRRASTSSICRSSYTEEDDWSGQKGTSNKPCRKRKRKKISTEKDPFVETNSAIRIKSTSYNQKDFYDSDEDLSRVTEVRKIKTYAEVINEFDADIKLRNKGDEDWILKLKNRTSYKVAIENGSHSDYAYDIEKRNRFRNRTSQHLSKSDTEHSNKTSHDFKIDEKRENSIEVEDWSDNLVENKKRTKKPKSRIPTNVQNEDESNDDNLVYGGKQEPSYKQSNENVEKAIEALEMQNECVEYRSSGRETNEESENENETELENISNDSTKETKSLKIDTQSFAEEQNKNKDSPIDEIGENVLKKRFSMTRAIRQMLSPLSSPT